MLAGREEHLKNLQLRAMNKDFGFKFYQKGNSNCITLKIKFSLLLCYQKSTKKITLFIA